MTFLSMDVLMVEVMVQHGLWSLHLLRFDFGTPSVPSHEGMI